MKRNRFWGCSAAFPGLAGSRRTSVRARQQAADSGAPALGAVQQFFEAIVRVIVPLWSSSSDVGRVAACISLDSSMGTSAATVAAAHG